MTARMIVRGLAIAAVAALLAGGCAAAPATPHAHPVHLGGGPLGYWTRSRLIGARPWEGSGFHPPRRLAHAHAAVAALRVGALFVREPGGNHFCTASVVARPGQDLLITAAHCINGGKNGGYRQNIVFIPGYHDGQAPFGVWEVKQLLVAPQWSSGSDPDLDVGFVLLDSRDGRNIEEVLGANQLNLDLGYRYLVRVTGYPASADAPITCANWTSQQSPTQLRFECGGFTGGTSGSPWVTRFDPHTRTGTIVGILGGYQEGGNTPYISYSPYLGPAVQHLYAEAVAAETATAA